MPINGGVLLWNMSAHVVPIHGMQRDVRIYRPIVFFDLISGHFISVSRITI